MDTYSESDEGENEEYCVKNYEENIHRSAIKTLTQVPGLSEQKLRGWLHTLRTVNVVEDSYDDICTYLGNGQETEHGFGLKLHSIFRIVRKGEHEFNRNECRKRMLLWHGTQTQFVPLILEHGFKPPPAKGQMFGAGVYFADRASKSAQYCEPGLRPKIGQIGYMFLCDVILGESYNALHAKNNYTSAPVITTKSGAKKTFDSVKCTGGKVPDINEEIKVGKMRIPLGKTILNTKFQKYTVRFNEFIVYEPKLIKPKYLVKIEFVQNKVNY